MGSRLKTSGKQKPHKSISETSSITCPALNCKQEVFAKKKYRQHLTDTYREENLQDLSPFGQTELSSSTNTLTRSQPRQVRTQAKRHRTALTDEPKESSKAWQTLSFTLLAQLTDWQVPTRSSDWFCFRFLGQQWEDLGQWWPWNKFISSESEKLSEDNN